MTKIGDGLYEHKGYRLVNTDRGGRPIWLILETTAAWRPQGYPMLFATLRAAAAQVDSLTNK